jgi:hypothetical protein
MNIDERVKRHLGEQVFQLIILAERLDAAEKELASLKMKAADDSAEDTSKVEG